MKERKPVADAVSGIAWAYVLLLLDLNFGRLNVLPNWLGMLIIADAIKKLAAEKEEAMLLRPLAVGIAVWQAVCGGVYLLLGLRLNIPAVGVVVTALALYLHFQLLTNIADIAKVHGFRYTKHILALRTVKTLLHTASVLPWLHSGEGWAYYATVAVSMVVAVWICVVMFMLRKHLGWTSPPNPEMPDMPPINKL